MAVIHNCITRLTVYSLKTREVVRQGLFCRAHVVHHLNVQPAWRHASSQQCSLELQQILLAELGRVLSYSSSCCAGAVGTS